jgi:hypothetical protein
MKTGWQLTIAAAILIVGIAIGAFAYRAWYLANTSEDDARRLLNNLYSRFIPGQSKETYMLIALAGEIDKRDPAETRRYICRLIDIKIAMMAEATKQISVPRSSKLEEELRALHAAGIPTADDVVRLAHCPLDSLQNIAASRTEKQ